MENNSDKQMQDKLKEVEFPFDPQAWEKMEAMLDQKKKRKGFFWWWTGGIAVVLLVGLVGYELGITSEKVKGKSEKLKVNTTAAVGSEQQNANSKTQIVKEKSRESEISNQRNANITTAESVVVPPSGVRGQRGKNAIALIRVNLSNPRHPRANVFSKKNRKASSLTEFANETASTNANQSLSEPNPFKEEVEMLVSAAAKNSLAERIEMDKIAGLLEASEDKYSFDKKSEDALPKKKKKIFNYSLGVMANVTGTTLGSQSENRQERPALFYKVPSYAAGFTHEFLFINRIAISNSVLYSQTGFKVYQPSAPPDSSTITKNYSAAISELQIPLGIKAYPVVKKYFRFSIAAGIINNIKLSEKFTVEKQTHPPVLSSMITFDNTFVSTADNPFIEGLNKSTSINVDRTPGEQGEYFGMGGLRRYYASFYASAGIEFIAKKHFVFFTEPMFYMSLKKIGLQDKRKYNFGANAGFRYRF